MVKTNNQDLAPQRVYQSQFQPESIHRVPRLEIDAPAQEPYLISLSLSKVSISHGNPFSNRSSSVHDQGIYANQSQNKTVSTVSCSSRNRFGDQNKTVSTVSCSSRNRFCDQNNTVSTVVTSDIDMRSDDPYKSSPYATDIFEYLRQLEVKAKSRPLIDYMEKIQKEIDPIMRGVLVDWLVEVAEEYKLLSDTLYLAISYIDRFLSIKSVTKLSVQLLGVSAFLIASKYEGVTYPSMEDFCYTKQEIVEMEADILITLEFELGCPTTKTFLRQFKRVAQEDFQEEFLSSYISELSLLDYNCVKFLPSIVAASSIFLARFIIRPNQHPWSLKLEEYTKYKAGDLKECVGLIYDLYLSRRGGAFQATRKKYKQDKCVATMPIPLEIPLTYFEDIDIKTPERKPLMELFAFVQL